MKNKSDLNDSDIGIDSSHCTQKNLNLLPYWGLVSLRFLLTVFPQSGYIHPDEFFQSVEVVAGDVLGVDVNQAWEFNSSRPIRSIAFPYLVSWLPFSIERYIFYNEGTGFIPPKFLLIGPRLIVCLVSFISDYCLYRTCYVYGQNYRARLLAFSSSYVAIVYGTRTLSNTVEMALTSLVLYCVAEAMCHTDQGYAEKNNPYLRDEDATKLTVKVNFVASSSLAVLYQDDYLQEKLKEAKGIAERVRISRLRTKLPNHTFRHCPILGAALAFGIFIRPTFLVFSAPAVFFWLRRGPRGSSMVMSGTPYSALDIPSYAHFHMRAAALAACAIIVAIPLLIADTLYYEKNIVNPLLPVVATPFNFMLYNSNSDNLQLHGFHPWWLHVLVNLPLLFGPLGIFALMELSRLVWLCVCRRWARLPRSESPTALMLASLVVPLFVLSAIPHQEPRFLIPLVFPIVFLYAQDIRGLTSDDSSGSGSWIHLHRITPYVWCLFNLILGLFYGFVHQGGVWPVTAEIGNRLSDNRFIPWGVSEIHIFTSHIYMLPRHTLQLQPKRIKRMIEFHEMNSMDIKELVLQIRALQENGTHFISKRSKYRRDDITYLVIPGVLEREFRKEAAQHFLEVQFEWSHFPHLSMEAPLPWMETSIDHLQTSQCSSEGDQKSSHLDHCMNVNDGLVTQESLFRKFSLLLLRIFPKCSHKNETSCLAKFSI